MKTLLCYVLFFMVIFGMSVEKAEAEEPLQFPTTRKDISDALSRDLGSPKELQSCQKYPLGDCR
ncbi:hypothetical protein [Desulfonema magnum]|uniref:hypothetical protein n=1 Tax=Desulfonema magnum TaxID=45655 RepID=UPI001A9B720C|nr:hypothetical protein [Desulfonema magnum]